jgi:hypothetical protein
MRYNTTIVLFVYNFSKQNYSSDRQLGDHLYVIIDQLQNPYCQPIDFYMEKMCPHLSRHHIDSTVLYLFTFMIQSRAL